MDEKERIDNSQAAIHFDWYIKYFHMEQDEDIWRYKAYTQLNMHRRSNDTNYKY